MHIFIVCACIYIYIYIITAGEIRKCYLDVGTFRTTICDKIFFKLGKIATETYRMLQTAFGASCINRVALFMWHKRFKEARESVKDDEKCRRSKEVTTPELTGQTVRVTMLRFYGSSGRDSIRRGQHSSNRVSGIYIRTMHQSPTHSLSHYLSKMGIKTVPHHPYSPELAPCDFWLIPQDFVMRQLWRWKRLWRRLLTRSHKRTSMEPSRICLNGATSVLQPEEISSKGTRVSCVCYQKSAHTKNVLKIFLIYIYIYIYIYINTHKPTQLVIKLYNWYPSTVWLLH